MTRLNRAGEHIRLLHRFEGYEGNQRDLRSKVPFITTNDELILVWTVGALYDVNFNLNKFSFTDRSSDTFSCGVHKYVKIDNRVSIIKECR